MHDVLERTRPVREGCPEWFPDWRGETCILVASGPSAKDVPLEKAKGKARFIAVNNSWQLCPWADALYACDWAWWNNAQGCPEFTGLKMSIDRKACVEQDWDIKRVHCNKIDDRLELKEWGRIGWGGNSGFGALNLAAQFGCTKIIMVGYDMTAKHGSHWHGDHPTGMHNPSHKNTERWRRAIDAAGKQLAGVGVKVINCSMVSVLKTYPKMSFEEALAS